MELSMCETRISSLNPNANSFIPFSFSSQKDAKATAQKLLADYVSVRINSGEMTFTKEEIIDIVEKLVSSNYKVDDCKRQMLHYKSYICKRLPELLKVQDVEIDYDSKNSKTALSTFDLSVFKPPKPSTFLSTLFGVYRHEQAVRPQLIMTHRQEFEDKVWSVTSQDLKLWNACCSEPCECPPMFGYSVPPSFFGNPFNLDYKCSNQSVHVSRYPEQLKGNELILLDSRSDSEIVEEPFVDYDENAFNTELSLESYSEQLKKIVSGVCNLITEDESTEDSVSEHLMDSYTEYEVDPRSFWDSDPSTLYVKSDEILEDDNYHPLLEIDSANADEGVYREMIRRSVSPESKEDNDETFETDEECYEDYCDPPCSIWCRNSPQLKRSDSVSSSSSASAVISLLNDTTDFLLNASEGCLANENTNLNPDRADLHKRNFRRSFSANDCDSSYDERFKLDYNVLHFASSSRDEDFTSMRNSIDFKTLEKQKDLWRDSDSGIDSHWSSQEDFDCDSEMRDELYCDLEYSAPMWLHFSGEDSLWKPLPDCALPEHMKFQHKRVRDLRRQLSIN